MNYININYNLNQKYIVHENAFQSIVQFAIKEIPHIRLFDEPRISFDQKTKNISIFIEIKVKNNEKIEPIFKHLVSKINTEVKNLTDIKPQNIQIRFLGFY